MSGVTAYAGFYEVCSPQKEEIVLVSVAFGAVGQLVGQLAKLHGCYVTKSVGSSQQSDYLHQFPHFMKDVCSYYKKGKIVYIEDMNQGLESGPAAFGGLFSGKNVGKQVICVAPE